MIDWIVIWDELMSYIQWATMLGLLILMLGAGICFFISRSTMWKFIFAIVGLLIITMVLEQTYHISLLPFDMVSEFFGNLFN